MRAANSGLVEEGPGLVEHEQRRPAVEARLQAMEQVGEHRRDQALHVHQRLHLDVQHVVEGECLGRAVEQPAVGAVERVGRQRRHQGIGLHQHGEAGQRALGPGRGGEALERRPHGVLDVRGDRHALVGEQPHDPFQREGDLARLVDAGERLQRERAFEAELDRLAAHGEGGGAGRASAVEEDDLRTAEAAELQGEQRQQHRLARSGGADDEGMADIADVQIEPERRAPSRLGHHQRRCPEMAVHLRPGPHRRDRHHVGEVQGVHDRLAHVGVGVAGQRAEPGLHRVRASRGW